MTPSRDSGPKNNYDSSPNTHGQWTQVAQRHFDPSDDADLTVAIVLTLAAAEGVSPTDLRTPPLYDVVDAPALQDSLFGSAEASASRRGTGTFEFRYNDYLVKVRSDGWIQVYEPAESASP